MKDIPKRVLKELNVNSYAYIILISLFFSCSGTRNTSKQEKSDYNIEKFKTFDSLGSWITIKTYDKRLKESIPAFVKINNIYFSEKKIFEVVEDKHSIGVYFVQLLPLELKNLNVKKGDSTVIKAYLKEDNNPLH